MINVEIKAWCSLELQERIEALLEAKKALYLGTDCQTDTYFKVNKGRLKLREGNIENALIQYERANEAGPKLSKYNLTLLNEETKVTLKNSLLASLGVFR